MAGDAGLEPTHVAVKVLCLTDLANPLHKVVSAQGFEPRTHALEGRCSIQLSYAPKLLWSGKRDSNSRLQPWQGCALPLNYSRSFIKLNKNGADEGSRTPTPMALDPKSSASANSATSAYHSFILLYFAIIFNNFLKLSKN